MKNFFWRNLMLLVLETNFGLCYSKEIDVFERARQGEPAQVRTENANPRNIQEFNELKYKSKNSHWKSTHNTGVCISTYRSNHPRNRYIYWNPFLMYCYMCFTIEDHVRQPRAVSTPLNVSWSLLYFCCS